MIPCECREHHTRQQIVLTGGPGAGKTAVLELVRRSLCVHMTILPEAAGIVFGGGFPRREDSETRRAGQRAIFFVQRELEEAAKAVDAAIVLCDRGTVDGMAYWPGPEPLWAALGTSYEEQLARYTAVIHMRTPAAGGYNNDNPLRVENAREAQEVDARVAAAWAGHPQRFFIEPDDDFLVKAEKAVDRLRQLMPECCRGHIASHTRARLTSP
jgi:predicted ATPase